MHSVTAFLLFFLLVWPTLGSAQNLIPFPSFDSSSDLTNGWGNLGPGKLWSSTDVDNSPASGSLLKINDLGTGAGVLVFSPCVAVSEGQVYSYGACYFMQVFQPGSDFGQVGLQWFDSCGGSFIGGDVRVTSPLSSLTTRPWIGDHPAVLGPCRCGQAEASAAGCSSAAGATSKRSCWRATPRRTIDGEIGRRKTWPHPR